jgi:hypothetical protein
MKPFIYNRLKEASTWRGIVLILTALGVPILPEMAETIITIGIAVTGIIGVVTPDAA